MKTAVAAALVLLLPPALHEPQDLGERNVSAWPNAQAEVSIAVDAGAPHRVVLASMNDEGRMMVAGSVDGGAVFERTFLPLPQGALLQADPMVAFDTRGVLHLASIPVAPGNRSMGIELRRSFDAGRTWSEPLLISKAAGRDDKVALAVDASPGSPYRDRIYVAWKWGSGSIFVARSPDSGRSFTRPQLVDTHQVSGLDLTTLADGQVFLAANDAVNHKIRVWRSEDGGATFAESTVPGSTRADFYTRQPSHCLRESLVHASIAADTSEGPHRGRLSVTWSDYESASCTPSCQAPDRCHTRIFFAQPDDQGRTWSSSRPLPDQVGGSDRFHQWARVDPTSGDLYVAYKDTRLDPLAIRTDTWLSRSVDGGSTWDPSRRVSGASSDASHASSFQYGDYQGLAVAQGFVYPAWADYRDGSTGEIFVGRLHYEPTSATRAAASVQPSLPPGHD